MNPLQIPKQPNKPEERTKRVRDALQSLLGESDITLDSVYAITTKELFDNPFETNILTILHRVKTNIDNQPEEDQLHQLPDNLIIFLKRLFGNRYPEVLDNYFKRKREIAKKLHRILKQITERNPTFLDQLDQNWISPTGYINYAKIETLLVANSIQGVEITLSEIQEFFDFKIARVQGGLKQVIADLINEDIIFPATLEFLCEMHPSDLDRDTRIQTIEETYTPNIRPNIVDTGINDDGNLILLHPLQDYSLETLRNQLDKRPMGEANKNKYSEGFKLMISELIYVLERTHLAYRYHGYLDLNNIVCFATNNNSGFTWSVRKPGDLIQKATNVGLQGNSQFIFNTTPEADEWYKLVEADVRNFVEVIRFATKYFSLVIDQDTATLIRLYVQNLRNLILDSQRSLIGRAFKNLDSNGKLDETLQELNRLANIQES